MTDSKKVVIIGSGIGGMVSAALLAQSGYEVEVYEKNEHLGGRLNYRERDGYFIDIGPSWFMQLDAWEQTFQVLGKDLYSELDIKMLEPGYKVWFKDTDFEPLTVPSGNVEAVKDLFESIEAGAGDKLGKYLDHAESNYTVANNHFLHRPYNALLASLPSLFKRDLMLNLGWFDFVITFRQRVNKLFKDTRLRMVMEWITLFAGAAPAKTPALYTLMSVMDFKGGIHYPMGGMYEITKALVRIGQDAGVKYYTNSEVTTIIVDNNDQATGIKLLDGSIVMADIVVSNADVLHTHQKLVPKSHAQYSDKYWESRSHSPAAMLLYLGVDGESLPGIGHHNFIFGKNWDQAFTEMYDEFVWPEDPYLYFTVPSIIDRSIVPEGKHLLYILIPVAPGLESTPEFEDKFYERVLDTLISETGLTDLRERIDWSKRFTITDMESEYYAPGGSGFGIGHTLPQSAWWRPKTQHAKIKNLYLCGQSTNPGTGIANAGISGQVVYKRIMGIKHAQPLSREEIKPKS